MNIPPPISPDPAAPALPDAAPLVGLDCRQAVASIVLNDPATCNALTLPMLDQLRGALQVAEAAPEVRVVLIRGAGRHFCTGAGLDWLAGDPAAWHRGSAALLALYDKLRDLRLPVVAAVQGAAIGGAVGLLGLCDSVITTEDARWSLPELELGMVPTALIRVLADRLPALAARRLLLDGRPFDGAAALRHGLASGVGPASMLEALAQAEAVRLAALPPVALAETREILRRLAAIGHDAARAAVAEAERAAPHHPETRAGIAALLALKAR